jgi:hypothetical protein
MKQNKRKKKQVWILPKVTSQKYTDIVNTPRHEDLKVYNPGGFT